MKLLSTPKRCNHRKPKSAYRVLNNGNHGCVRNYDPVGDDELVASVGGQLPFVECHAQHSVSQVLDMGEPGNVIVGNGNWLGKHFDWQHSAAPPLGCPTSLRGQVAHVCRSVANGDFELSTVSRANPYPILNARRAAA